MDGGAKYCKPTHSEEESRKQMPWTIVVVMTMILDDDGEGSGGEGVVPSCPALVSLVPWPRGTVFGAACVEKTVEQIRVAM